MDIQTLIQALTNTLDPGLREQAEGLLEEVHRLPDFAPCLLQIVMDAGVPLPARQAGAVYLKNTIFKYWKERDGTEVVGSELPYSIPEPSKTLIRNNIIGAIIQSPTLISRQLCVCLEHILKIDFPKKWTGIVTTVHSYLSSSNQPTWYGSLLAFYQLSKKYKYKKADERVDYISAMHSILPLLYQRMMDILPDPSVTSVALQHIILKIFYATMQYSLPLELMNDSTLPGWIFVLQTILQRPVPQEAQDADEDDRPQLEWWKCKKWALHIVCQLFGRYGCPGNVEKDYSVFANYFVKTFNAGIINVLLRQLEVMRQGGYLTPRVIQGIFKYFLDVVSHANSWKLVKPHFQILFTDIIFPMMCYNDDDDELWRDNPYEYIRLKFDIFEDLISPVVAAQHFLVTACAKRKNVLDPVMAVCVQVLNAESDFRKLDGALHVIGQVADVLMKKQLYRDQLESMLVTHVFPKFQSEFGYIRARACSMLHFFSEIQFENEANLQIGLQQVFNCLTQDKELPVKVEAAVALQFLIRNQPTAETFVKPHVKPIIQELLVVIRETENDDLTAVMQELIETYDDQIGDVAVGICASLVATFNEIYDEGTDDDSYKALTALGILTAIQALIKAVFNESQVMQQMEANVIQMIAAIFRNEIIDFYEEMLALLDLFTTVSISPQMWQMMGIIYDTFVKDGFDYFTEMMSVLYNFVKVDSATFLSNSKHIEIVISMCKAILSGDPGEDPQVHACKLLEVLLLQCQGKIDAYVADIMGTVLERLTQESKTPELRTMCLQVVVAGLYYNTPMIWELLEKIRFPDHPDPITAQFFSQWLKDADLYTGIHDRKMSVLGFCSVLQCPVRPAPVVALAPKIIPTVVSLLEELIDSYKMVAGEEEDEDAIVEEDGQVDGEDESKELDSEEDDIDEEADAYSKELAKAAAKMLGEGDDSDDDMAETLLEVDYETIIDDDLVDEFLVFKLTLEALSTREQEWYATLTGTLPPEFSDKIQKVFVYAEQRRAVNESRQIEEAGGYSFTVTDVPNAFVFSSPES